ncbi:MAG: cupin domain-containing protein [Planctomycetes bacterium]|nr:cupin domain-containing protein [Planctomycetota bacterium]
MANDGPLLLSKYPAHLGLGATTVPQPEFTRDMSWYMEYGTRHAGDGVEGRLLSMHTFDASWDSWEVHPRGSEVVLVTAGTLRLHQERDGTVTTLDLGPGEYAINEPGVWHTADVVDGPATAVFITSGIGTEVRPR